MTDLEQKLIASLARFPRALPPKMHMVQPTAGRALDDAHHAALAEKIRTECADLIELVARAIRSPRISREYLESAQFVLTTALEAARELDPEPESA